MRPHEGAPLSAALLIDDDTALLSTWQRVASEKGLHLDVASTWDEGLTMFHVLSPDLVIADYNLPGSSHGLRLLEEIRRLRPTVRLVLISGAVEPSDLEEAERLGIADRVLSKGDSQAALAAVVEELVAVVERSTSRTSWVAFASASVAAAAIDHESLTRLDDLLASGLAGDA